MIDIDHFKKLNDAHGHKAGDAVLVHTARVLASSARVGSLDGVFRYGGEEFCMILPRTDRAAAASVLEAVRARVEATQIEHDGKERR